MEALETIVYVRRDPMAKVIIYTQPG